MKRIYEVRRKEISYEYVYIEAPNRSKAKQIAESLESEDWRTGGYNSKIDNIQLADLSELQGLYIETEKEPFIYKKN